MWEIKKSVGLSFSTRFCNSEKDYIDIKTKNSNQSFTLEHCTISSSYGVSGDARNATKPSNFF